MESQGCGFDPRVRLNFLVYFLLFFHPIFFLPNAAVQPVATGSVAILSPAGSTDQRSWDDRGYHSQIATNLLRRLVALQLKVEHKKYGQLLVLISLLHLTFSLGNEGGIGHGVCFLVFKILRLCVSFIDFGVIRKKTEGGRLGFFSYHAVYTIRAFWEWRLCSNMHYLLTIHRTLVVSFFV
ncbi:hypothetical protein VTN02DRAFT_4107 [Thermoascus thermophilus]